MEKDKKEKAEDRLDNEEKESCKLKSDEYIIDPEVNLFPNRKILNLSSPVRQISSLASGVLSHIVVQPSAELSSWPVMEKTTRTFFPTTLYIEEEQKLRDELNEYQNKANEYFIKLQKAEKKSQQWKRDCDKLNETLSEVLRMQKLTFILERINEDAKNIFLKSEDFRRCFLEKSSCSSFTISIDIRRSTELMLKARSPELYAQFISTLCAGLREIILIQHGVYDKFTGDGIFAFFPDFYSGEDAGYFSLSASDKCHKFFREFYHENRKCFTAILKNVGLGIGIDYGETHLVHLGDGLTVVGTPVVYACRMSGAVAGTTLLNQSAYEQISNKYRAYCDIEEAEIDVKHEGTHVAYAAKLNEHRYDDVKPAGWLSFRESEKQPAPSDQPS